MNKPELEALLEDLQDAKEGSRELSDRVLFSVGWTTKQITPRTGWYRLVWIDHVDTHYRKAPDPTRSVDDALDCMVPEGWYLCDMNAGDHGALALLRRYQTSNDDIKDLSVTLGHTQTAATLALAICCARIQQLIGECDD